MLCLRYAVAMSLRDKQRVIYTTPIKALSNQKYRELFEEFQDVGLMTGDVTINPTASALVMTTEVGIFLNRCSLHIFLCCAITVLLICCQPSIRRRSSQTFSTDFEIFRRRFDSYVIYFFNSDFKFFHNALEFSVTSLYVVFIFSLEYVLIFL